MVSAPTSLQSSQSAGALTRATNDNVNQEQFLKLLIAQLQNQDPLNPIENQEFVAELATFSSLEQQQKQTDLLSQLVNANQSTSTSQALALIGTDVVTSDTGFRYEYGDEIEFDFLATQTGTATVYLTSASGSTEAVDTIEINSRGQHTYVFKPGENITEGNYTLSIVSSVDSSGNQNQYETFMRGGVEGVTFSNGEAMLTVNGRAVPMNSVQAIFEREAA